jgi:hypothetical protein
MKALDELALCSYVNPNHIGWLTRCPASDINFKGTLQEATLGTLRAALQEEMTATNRKAIEARERKLSKVAVEGWTAAIATDSMFLGLPAAENAGKFPCIVQSIGWIPNFGGKVTCANCIAFEQTRCARYSLAITSDASCSKFQPKELKPSTEGDTMSTEIVPQDPPNPLEQAAASATQLATLEQAVTADQIQAAQFAGMVQGMTLVGKLVTVTTFKMLAQIKESKQYKGSKLLADGKVVTVTTWEEYCRACGISREIVDENIRNLSALGEGFLEYSQKIGLGYRELRKLRKLPEDTRTAIIQEVEVNTGDKEAVLELIDSLAAKHAQEKADLEKKVTDLEGTVAAARRRGEETAKERDDLKEQLYKKEFEPTDWPGRVESINIEITAAVGTALRKFDELEQFRAHIVKLQEEGAPDSAIRALAVNLLDRIDQLTTELQALAQRAYQDLEPIRELARMGEPDFRLSDLPDPAETVEI